MAMSLFQIARSGQDDSVAAEYYQRAARIYAKIYGKDDERTRKMDQRSMAALAAASANCGDSKTRRRKNTLHGRPDFFSGGVSTRNIMMEIDDE